MPFFSNMLHAIIESTCMVYILK